MPGASSSSAATWRLALALLVACSLGVLAGCGDGPAGATRVQGRATGPATGHAHAARSGGATPTPGTPTRGSTSPPVPAVTPGPVTAEPFTVASFNTLGAAHTGRHGNKPWMASGEVRTLRMASVLRRHAVDLVGLQEFEAPQAAVFRRHAAAAYAFWHPRGRSANTIAWRRDRFALVRATTERVHYFEGRVQPMPVVLLRDLRSPGVELWVVNVHNPAGTRNHPRQQHWRTLDMAAERAVVRRLLATGRPVLLTGDMNEKAEAFCAFTSNGPLHAAAGAARGDGRCRPPANARIDWIFGSARVRFTDYRVDRSALVRRTTDHSVVLARARVVPPGS